MKRMRWIIIVVILIIAGLLYIVTQQENGKHHVIRSSRMFTAATKTLHVEIKSFRYFPPTLSVHAGDTIVWTNHDTVKHTVTSDSGVELVSDYLGKRHTYSHTFFGEGTYPYHCIPHPYMKGTVIVK